METKVQNIIKVPVTHTDLQKLTKAINDVPNPLFSSPIDLLKKFTTNMYHILMDFDNGKNVEMAKALRYSIDNMYHQNDIASVNDLFNKKPQLTMHNPANSKNKLPMDLPGANHEKPKVFSEQYNFDRTIRLKLKTEISNRLLEFANFNEPTLVDLLSLYVHNIANHPQIIYPRQEMPNNKFINGGSFTYMLGFEKASPLLEDTLMNNSGLNDLNGFRFYQNNNKATIDDDIHTNSHFDLKKPVAYSYELIQKAYINQILTIRKQISELSIKSFDLNLSHNTAKTKKLNAFDYLNLLFTRIIARGHIETNDINYRDIIRKYEDPIPVTNFLLTQFNKMKSNHAFGFAQDLLIRYGEKLDKETQVELIKHLNDYTVFQFEKTSTFSSYTDYNIKSLVELNPESLKDYILETFNLKNVDGFRNFLSDNPQWVK